MELSLSCMCCLRWAAAGVFSGFGDVKRGPYFYCKSGVHYKLALARTQGTQSPFQRIPGSGDTIRLSFPAAVLATGCPLRGTKRAAEQSASELSARR